MARLVRGDDVADLWVEERGDTYCLLLAENGDPPRLVSDKLSFYRQREYDELMSERLRDGWRRVRDPASELDDDEPREPTLEAALAADPDDAAAALVYADWYQQHDHPRGELITVQHALATRPDDAELRAREAALLDEWKEYLLGPLARRRESYHLGLELTWQHGFLRAARLDGHGNRGESEQLLWELLRHPSARFLRELVVGCHQFGDQNNRLITDLLLRAGPTPPLRSLFLADFDDSNLDNIDISRAPLGDLTGLGERYPRLEDVILKGRGDFDLGSLHLPRARRFAIRTSSLARETLAAVLAAPWPHLEELELWFGAAEYGADCRAHDLAPLFRGSLAPKLRVLRLMNAEFTDDIVASVIAFARDHPLEVIDFSLGTLGAVGADQLIAGRDALAGLRELYVHDCCLSVTALRRLREAGLPIVETAPFPGGGWHQTDVYRTAGQKQNRYVSVSE